MKVVTFNANGIRSAARKGFYEWMLDTDADFVCIQELKAQKEQLTEQMLAPAGYQGYFHCAQKKGYSGTAIYTKCPPVSHAYGFGWEDFDAEGRCVRLDFDSLSVISIYLPSGTSSNERQVFKEDVLERLKPLLTGFRDDSQQFIICGDINIAHRPVDIRNWKGNQKNSGFLPQERAWMDWLFGDTQFVDAFRVVDTRPGQYTWWSNRGNAYEKNVGWRLDYQIISSGLKDKIESFDVYRDTKFSDHAPVIGTYNV